MSSSRAIGIEAANLLEFQQVDDLDSVQRHQLLVEVACMKILAKAQTAGLEKAVAWMDRLDDASTDELSAKWDEINTGFLAQLEGLTPDQIDFSPGEGEWCIKEVCLHVSNAVRGTAMGVSALATGKSIEGDPRLGVKDDDPGNFEDVLANLQKAFRSAADSAGRLESADTNATMKHPYFGALNARGWFVFNLMHIKVHINQIKRIKGSVEYPT